MTRAIKRAFKACEQSGERMRQGAQQLTLFQGVATLRPFFGYYGGKWRDAPRHYPAPHHETIVEPFAGSAGYSVRYYTRKVILCEIDPIVAGVWSYLLRVKSSEIRALPDLPPDGTVEDLDVPQEARWLIGFWLNGAASGPRKSASSWMRGGLSPSSFWGARVRETIAAQVDQIRHWRVHHGSYETAPLPRVATWFVDPPYQVAGSHYRYGSKQIDYDALGAWCRSCEGQVIVCEAGGADWLPFRSLGDVKTARARRAVEAVWLSEDVSPPIAEALVRANVGSARKERVE